ncbi:hypothetical protein [Aliiroseovarius sp. 2305UL8-7]|uniref:hypothetical protein n=1 Tax=Aliiroseovarius conchicola TaxID=3121637 RepID=UPI003526D51D
MTNSRQHLLFTALFENFPSIVFLALVHWSGDLRLAGWAGAILAAVVCTAYTIGRLRPHPVLLGINIYMLVITPTVETIIFLGLSSVADTLIANAQSFVLVAILLTGSTLTLISQRGFIGVQSKHPKLVVRYSFVLLAISLLSVLWTFVIHAERFVEIGVPLLFLFGVRQFLAARIEDQEERQTGGRLVVPAALGSQAQELDFGA